MGNNAYIQFQLVRRRYPGSWQLLFLRLFLAFLLFTTCDDENSVIDDNNGTDPITEKNMVWQQLSLENMEISVLAVDAVNANIIYAVGIENSPYMEAILKSTDGGFTWDTLHTNVSYVTELVIDPHDPHTLFMSGFFEGIGSHSLFKSSDGGTTWAPSDSGIWRGMYGVEITAAFDPLQPGIMYAGTEGHDRCGLYKSSNAGEFWNPLSEDDTRLDGIEAVVVDPIDPNRLYVVVFNPLQALKSDDQGLSWETMEFQEHTSLMLKDIFIHPAGHDTLFASSWKEGAYRSTDYGATWKVIADSTIGTGRIREFAYFDGDIFAAVYEVNGTNHGVYVFSSECDCFRLAGGLVSQWAESEVSIIAVTKDNRLLAGTGSGIWEYVEVPE